MVRRGEPSWPRASVSWLVAFLAIHDAREVAAR